MTEEPTLSPSALDGLAKVASSDPEQTVQRALAIARDVLGMDLGYVAEFKDGKQVYSAVEGDGSSFSMEEGESHLLEDSYCRRMTLGQMPNAIHDARDHEATRDLALTEMADIGSYIGVPISFSDGTLYGTICCTSHESNDELAERDVKFLQVLARFVGGEIEQRALASENTALKREVHELRIEIDQSSRDREVADISETEWFQELRQRAAQLRAR